ncbi:MAG TPA: hypothetical protein VGJ26_11820, partial [Pirellulales bacterium]
GFDLAEMASAGLARYGDAQWRHVGTERYVCRVLEGRDRGTAVKQLANCDLLGRNLHPIAELLYLKIILDGDPDRGAINGLERLSWKSAVWSHAFPGHAVVRSQR